MVLVKLAAILFVMTSLSPMTSSAEKNVAEVRLFVDDSAMTYWKNATGFTDKDLFLMEMRSNFFEINNLFKGVSGFNLQIQIEDVIMMNEDILNTNNGRIDVSDALKEFQGWVLPKYVNDKYDVAILFTGADLIDTLGHSHWSSVCSSMGLAVIQFQATYDNVMETTHQLGHIFGATDLDETAYECKDNFTQGIMSNVYPMYERFQRFSSCSINSIKAKIDKLNNDGDNCMSAWNKSRTITGPRYGFIVSADEICKRTQGPSSYSLAKPYPKCDFLKCKTDSDNYVRVSTPQGMKCGWESLCEQGKCMRLPESGALCPDGDQPEISGEPYNTCSNLTKTQCFRLKETCCKSCFDSVDLYIPEPGTEYDRTRSMSCYTIINKYPLYDWVRVHRGSYFNYMNGVSTANGVYLNMTRTELETSFGVKTTTVPTTNNDEDIVIDDKRIASNRTCAIIEELDPNSDRIRVIISASITFQNGETKNSYDVKSVKKSEVSKYQRDEFFINKELSDL